MSENMEINYEDEQIQEILLKESEKKKIEMDRELKLLQELEYEQALKKDEESDLTFDEPSVEEMRRVRLLRFDGWKLIKD